MSGARLKGLKELEQELEKRFGKQNAQRISDEALKAGAKVFVEALTFEFATTPHKGYSEGATIDEITISDPVTINGVRTVRVHWRGPDGRYRIIHLNEFGTINNPNPPWKGVIARTMQKAERAYRNAIKEAIERGI